MSAVNPPFVIQALSHPGDVFRRAVKSLAEATSGVIAPGDMAVSQNGTPNMSVNVAAGLAVIQGTENATSQGSYVALNDAVVNLAIAASDPTNPRNDLVVAKVQDATYSGATNAWSLAVVTGTPAGSPVDPATPNNAIVLARVRVAALVTTIVSANITDLRPFLYNSNNPLGTTGSAISLANARVGRFIGSWTTAGAPTGLTGQVSDFGFDGNNAIWTCTAAGSPGTWRTTPFGSLGYAQVVANQGSITTQANLTSLTLTVTVSSGRRIRVTGHIEAQSTVTDDTVLMRILEGGSTLQGGYATLPILNQPQTVIAQAILTPTAASHTYNLSLERGAGTGTITMVAGSLTPAFILVEDIGV